MIKRITFTLLAISISICSYSQTLKTISGEVIAGNDESFYGYSAILLSPNDSALYKGDFFTDKKFSIESERKPLLLKISSLGYQDVIISIGTDEEILSPISLHILAIQLSGITIKADVPLYTQRDDRITLNVSNTILSQSGTAEDVLKKSVRVSVNNNTVSVVGRGDAIILIDGHIIPANKSLASISSSEIQKIDIITSPSAKYDAEGKAVIEITTKRAGRQFWGAEITSRLGKGDYWRGYTGVELSAKFSGLSLYGYYAFEPSKETMNESYIRDYTKTSLPQYITNDVKTTEKPITNNFKFSGEYKFTDRHTAGLQLSGQYSQSSMDINNISHIFKSDITGNELISSLQFGNQNKQYSSITGYYDYISKSGHLKWSTLIDESLFDSDKKLNITENISGNLNAKNSREGVAIDIVSVKSDVSIELPKDYKVDLGVKLIGSRNDSYTKLLTGNIIEKDIAYYYTEKIAAFYLMAGKKVGKWNMDAGVRLEAAGMFAEAETFAQDTVRINLFPSAYLRYAINDKWALTTKYAMRITRPTFQDLNPAITYVDTLSYTRGNPYLLPEIRNSIELKLTFREYAGLGFSYTNKSKAQSWYIEQDPYNPTVTMASQRNIDRSDVYTIDLLLPYQNKAKTLTAYMTTGVIHTVSNDKYANVVKLRHPMWYIYSGIDATLPYQLKFNTNIGYFTKGVNNIFNVEPMFRMDAGLQRNFCDDKLNVSLMWNDIFRSARIASYSTMNNLHLHYSFYKDLSYVQLSVRYRFRLQKSSFQSRSFLDSETERIKGLETGEK